MPHDRLFTLIISFFLFSGLNAQSSMASVSGVVEQSDHTPAAFATLQLKSVEDSALVKAEYTDDKGQYLIEGLIPGQYFIEVSYVGFRTFQTEPFSIAPAEKKTMPSVMLQLVSTELEAVIVVAKKPVIELKPDRTVFNIEGSINAAGSDAMELLQKAPGVVVDNNDQVSLNGKSGIQIHIDGKPSPLGGQDLVSFLRSIQASDIEAIELITNPSARYDAEGNAGIINIRLKKNKNYGVNGSLNLGYSVAENDRFNNSIQLNYRNKGVNLFGSYSNYLGQRSSFQNFFRVQNGLQFDQRTTQLKQDNNHNFRAGADFFLGKKHTIGVLVNGYNNSEEFNSSGESLIGQVGGSPEQLLEAGSMINGTRQNVQANLNYQFKDETGRSLNVDVDGGLFVNRLNMHQPNRYSFVESGSLIEERIFTSRTPTDIDLFSAKADYEQNLLGGKMSAGIKGAMVRTDNTLDFYELIGGLPVKDTDRSNQFQYDERVYAAYVNYQRSIGDSWNLQAGLRAERTHSIGELTSGQNLPEDYVERKYLDLFPSAGVTYAVNRDHSFRLNYSRRIDRPNYQDLNPFEFRLDELTYQKGNAFLQPQYANSLELTHSFKYKLNTTLGITVIEDYFARITDTVELRRSFITMKNLDRQIVLNLNISSPFTINEWWTGFTNLNLYQTTNEADFGDGLVVDITVRGLSLYNQHNFDIGAGFNVELSGFYNSPGLWQGIMETEEFWGIDAGIQRKLFDGKANLKLTVTDVFLSKRWAGRSDYGGMILDARGGWESRQLRLNFSYMFGNSQVKNSRRRTTSLDDEQRRLSSGQ